MTNAGVGLATETEAAAAARTAGAEIAPLRGRNRLFTHTGVLALVGEGPP